MINDNKFDIFKFPDWGFLNTREKTDLNNLKIFTEASNSRTTISPRREIVRYLFVSITLVSITYTFE